VEQLVRPRLKRESWIFLRFRHPHESGVVAMTLIFFVTTMVLAMGLILDGGRIYSAEEDAARDASSAARVAAQLPDQTDLLNGNVTFAAGGLEDPEKVARDFLFNAGYTDPAQIAVSFAPTPEGTTIRVEVHKTVPLLILGMIPGLGDKKVGAASQVRLRNEMSPQ
jgi:hypothetical protein